MASASRGWSSPAAAAGDPSRGLTNADRSSTVVAALNAASSTVTWNASSSAIISSTRSSELRPSSSIVVDGPIARPGANRPRIDATSLPRLRAPGRSSAGPSSHCRSSRRFNLRVPSVRGSSGPGHTTRSADALVIGRAWRSPPRTTSSTLPSGESTRTACTRSALLPASGAPTTADSRTPGCSFSTFSTSSGKTLSPSGVTIISFLRPRIWSCPSRVEFADVAGVEPAVLESRARFLRRVVVAARNVLAAHENLAVVGDFHLHAADGFSDRAPGGAERVIEGDDRCRLGQPVALDDDESEPAPKGLELGIERCGADDHRPEFPAEHAVDPPIAPPSPRPVHPFGRRLGRLRNALG